VNVIWSFTPTPAFVTGPLITTWVTLVVSVMALLGPEVKVPTVLESTVVPGGIPPAVSVTTMPGTTSTGLV
jgi:hypothetical protein